MSNSTVEKLEVNKVKITMPITAEKFEEGMKYSYNQNKSKVNIPGFRKGRVPRKMIESQFGKEFLYDEAINFVLPEAYEMAVDEHKLDVVSRPTIDVSEVTEDGITITAEVYIKPEVKISDYVGVEIEKIITEVSEEEILEEIKKEQENNSRTISIFDRPVADGDIATVDFEGFVDGVAFDGGKGEGYELVIGSHSFIDTFEEQLIGANAGDELDVNVTFPSEYGNQNLQGKPALFRVKIVEIKKKDLPELNDEFASEVSEFETLNEYKEDIKAKLSTTKIDAATRQKENKVVEALIAKAEMDIPTAMIDTRVNQMISDFAKQVESQGLKLEDYLTYMGQNMETLKNAYLSDATKQVSGRLVLEAIGQLENFEITEEEFDGEVERIANAYKMDKAQITSVLREEDRAGINQDLKTARALKLVVETAKEV